MFLYLAGVSIVILFVGWVIADQVRLRHRKGLSRDQFIAGFSAQGIPNKIPAAVYDHYSSFAVGRKYLVSPDDNYEAVLREGAEDIDDDAEQLLKKLNLQVPTESARRDWPSPLETVRDMVLWLDWVRRQQTSHPSD